MNLSEYLRCRCVGDNGVTLGFGEVPNPNPKPGICNLKPKTRNPKPIPEPETRNPKPESLNPAPCTLDLRP